MNMNFFSDVYRVQAEMNDYTLTHKGHIWQRTVSFHYLPLTLKVPGHIL